MKPKIEQTSLIQRVDMLEDLVEEILKDSPAEATIKRKMMGLSMEYTEDPIERINRILKELKPLSDLDLEEEHA